MATTLTQNSSIPFVHMRATCVLTGGSIPAIIQSTVDHNPNTVVSVGSTAGKINACISQPFTITSGTPLTINVASGLDPLGNAAGMVHVSSVIVENDSVTGGQDFTIGGGTHPVLGSDQYTSQANGGVACVFNPSPGYTVSGGSADTLTITVGAGTAVPGKVTILGRTA